METVTHPSPFIVKLSLENITASILFSSIFLISPVVEKEFSLPSAIVKKTLAACFTYTADPSSLLILTPFNTIRIFDSLSVSTKI